MNRNINRESGKLVEFFVNLKAAFNMINREILIKMLSERGLREKLAKRGFI